MVKVSLKALLKHELSSFMHNSRLIIIFLRLFEGLKVLLEHLRPIDPVYNQTSILSTHVMKKCSWVQPYNMSHTIFGLRIKCNLD